MVIEEVRDIISSISIGSKIQLVKKSGATINVILKSHEVEGIEKKNYGSLEVPAQPPAIIVLAGTRFGNTRIPIDDLIAIRTTE